MSWGHTVVPQLRAGVVLTDTYLARLQQAGLSVVYVRETEDVGEAPEAAGEELAPAAAAVAPEPAPLHADDFRAVSSIPTESRLRRIANTFRGSRAVLS